MGKNEFVDGLDENIITQNEFSSETNQKPNGLGVRHLQITLLFTGLMIAFSLRVNISFGIVAMINNSSNPEFEQFDWNESTRGLILSSLYWGFVIAPFPAGLLAQRFGAKILLVTSSAICSVLTLTLPIIAPLGWEYVCASRVVLGLFQGVYYPCIHTLLAKWVHPSEKGILSALTFSSPSAGILLMLSVSGVISSSSLGWPGIFYTSGCCSGIWSVIWLICGSNSPAEHKTISKKEREFIESANGTDNHRSFSTPWKHIFTSIPFWALLITYCTESWGYFTLMAVVPSYMDGILNFDIESNALFSALPYLVLLILVLMFCIISDYIVNHKYITLQTSRKIFNTIGMWIPASCWIGLGFITKENATWGVVLLTTGMGFNSGINVGYMTNHIDLSPRFAGTLMGITDTTGVIMSIMGPLFVGFVVYDMTDPELWRIFFFFTSGMSFVGNLIFIIFAEAKIQVWNGVDSK